MLIIESRYAKMIDWADLTEEKLTAAVGSSSFFCQPVQCHEFSTVYQILQSFIWIIVKKDIS